MVLGTEVAVPLHHFVLFLATLDGSLYGVDRDSGTILWRVQNEPMLRVELTPGMNAVLLPDPRTGSLYAVDNMGGIHKVPMSIHKIVSQSPFSMDGKLYTGFKKDTWISADLLSGVQYESLTPMGMHNYCPAVESSSRFFIAKSEYMISVFDRSSSGVRKHWNITYIDYVTNGQNMTQTPSDYGLFHFAASESGRMVTLSKTGELKWNFNGSSPVVGVYRFEPQRGLVRIPISTVGESVLDDLSSLSDSSWKLKQILGLSADGHPSLCLVKFPLGVYAVPLLLHERFLVEKIPAGIPAPSQNDSQSFVGPVSSLLDRLNPPSGFQPIVRYVSMLTNAADVSLQLPDISSNGSNMELRHRELLEDSLEIDVRPIVGAVVSCCIIAVSVTLVYFRRIRRIGSQKYLAEARGGRIRNTREFLKDSWIRVGKIVYDSTSVLGRGCEGTFVYRGFFDNRDVAVKRLVHDCYSVVDREVDMLRSSDQHPNVIRYFCTEDDDLFSYIALELCVATLEDYVSGDRSTLFPHDTAMPKDQELLEQAASGLAHLHKLNICHRDIKPHNCLLTPKRLAGKHTGTTVRLVISDFGLCKRLADGRSSYSKRSGASGTDGWIAPEVFDDESRTTCAVDVFSLGCLFYYVVCGVHPFGNGIHRQPNILDGSVNLNRIRFNSNGVLFKHLVEQMVAVEPAARPTAADVLRHPYFWNADIELQFLLDASDRIEKASNENMILRALERYSIIVTRGDWYRYISAELQADLLSFRKYNIRSVRDLLRALRNKKHHYSELNDELRRSLGTVPAEFVGYFTSRFPLLILDTYLAFRPCQTEQMFSKYYPLAQNSVQKSVD